ncbi:MAG: hypothetical protein H6813_04920 [Phycisphaeraceae bacterium]|nr:hypothetical protein [Phycisphaeraceae bacterium]MCB9847726.1 hypothetical protein [Phycisphaeraceae bacterium]
MNPTIVAIHPGRISMNFDWTSATCTLALTGPEIAALVAMGLCCLFVLYLKFKGRLPSDPGGSL